MEPRVQAQLEEAEAYFYSWRMAEAYAIFRRYFDRLPFKPEKEHAQYIGIFARILAELGKEFELKFYIGELEKHYEKQKDPVIAYPLAISYIYSEKPRWEAAKQILESLASDPKAGDYRARARMMLGVYYSEVKEDVSACRQLIFSIEEPKDPRLQTLVEIWKAKVLRDEKNYAEAENRLLFILTDLTIEKDWYAYFSAKNILANLYIQQKNMEKAALIVVEVKHLFEGRHFKSIQAQLQTLEKLIERHVEFPVLQLSQKQNESVLIYGGRTLALKEGQPAEKLISVFAKKRFLDKGAIIKVLYSRAYDAEQDDALIYYHIHSLRKCLKAIGLPSEAIMNEAEGYRLIPPVETVGGPRENH